MTGYDTRRIFSDSHYDGTDRTSVDLAAIERKWMREWDRNPATLDTVADAVDAVQIPRTPLLPLLVGWACDVLGAVGIAIVAGIALAALMTIGVPLVALTLGIGWVVVSRKKRQAARAADAPDADEVEAIAAFGEALRKPE